MQGEDAEKLTRGVFYTRGNPFVFPAFRRWYEAARPRMPLLEPFAGVGQIPKLVAEAGFEADWDLYDIDRSLEGVRHNDSLASFPRGYEMTITNPPYLSLHQANRKKLGVRREDFRGYPSLYLVAVEEALRACRYVAMIIPESFITSGYFRERLEHFVSLPFQMFDDTEMPTALVMWGPEESDDFEIWRADQRLGRYSQLGAEPEATPCAERLRFNDRRGTVGLRAIDDTRRPTIRFCPAQEIAPERIKHTSRMLTRISVRGLEPGREAELIDAANDLLWSWRERTEDVLLTAFKGVREDGRFRRRLDFARARALLSQALCRVEGHEHRDAERGG